MDDLDVVQQHLRDGYEAGILLHQAIQHDATLTFNYLMTMNDIDMNYIYNDVSPLILSILSCNELMTNTLIGDKRVDKFAKWNDCNILIMCADRGMASSVLLLRRLDIFDIDEMNRLGHTALRCAVNNNHTDIVISLINAGATLDGWCLIFAISNNNLVMVQSILQRVSLDDEFRCMSIAVARKQASPELRSLITSNFGI